MITKLKTLRLRNFCGYRDTEFDFTDLNGKAKQFIVLASANGCGKTSLLLAVKLVTNAKRFLHRDCSVLFNKYVFSLDYVPTVDLYKNLLSKLASNNKDELIYKNMLTDFKKNQMLVLATFLTDLGDKKVVLNEKGVSLNLLPYRRNGHSYFIDADHPMLMNKFSLPSLGVWQLVFLLMARSIYNFLCLFGKPILVGSESFYTDFIINKWGTKVHHKSMSAGLKKICCLLKSLCDIHYIKDSDIIMVDNVLMHIYYDRHTRLFLNLKLIYPDHQFVLTTHSGTLILYLKNNYQGKFLYDLWKYKLDEFKKFQIKNTSKG